MKQNRVKIVCIVVFILIFALLNTRLSAQIMHLDKAEQLYKTEKYELALNIYNTIYDKKPNNLDVLFNIGNVYFRLGKIGKSICFYRRAGKYLPRDGDTQLNLSVARNKIVDKVKGKDTLFLANILNINRFFSFNEVAVVFLIIAGLLCIMILMLSLKKRGELFKNLFFVILTILIFYSSLFAFKIKNEFFVKEGVITTKKIEVRTGPSYTLATLFFIHEGMEFVVIKRIGEWAQVRFKNGFVGWINEEDFWII